MEKIRNLSFIAGAFITVVNWFIVVGVTILGYGNELVPVWFKMSFGVGVGLMLFSVFIYLIQQLES